MAYGATRLAVDGTTHRIPEELKLANESDVAIPVIGPDNAGPPPALRLVSSDSF